MNTNKVVMKIVSVTFSICVFVLIIFGLYKIGAFAYDFGYRVFMEAAIDSEKDAVDKVVQITQSMSGKDIGEVLAEKELIRNANLFVVQLKLSSYADSIKPGTYTLSTSMNAKEMMQIMSAENVDDTETEE